MGIVTSMDRMIGPDLEKGLERLIGARAPGHYLSYVDEATGDLTTLDVPGFSEELEVVVEDGQLVARHAFWLFGLPFLVLHYRMHRSTRLAAEPAV